jgi:hypothetical protein
MQCSDVFRGKVWKALSKSGWYVVHLSTVYISVRWLTPFLGEQVYGWLMHVSFRGENQSDFQFLYSHLFLLSIIPAFCAGIINRRYERKAALFVWIVPSAILAYKFCTFHVDIFQSQIAGACHEYFASNFSVPAFRNYREMFEIAGSNSDVLRGIEQLRFTAPFFASIAYAAAALLGNWFAQKYAEKGTRAMANRRGDG